MKTKEYPARKPGETRYVEWDVEEEFWGVFGEDSGHCYGLYATEHMAEESIC